METSSRRALEPWRWVVVAVGFALLAAPAMFWDVPTWAVVPSLVALGLGALFAVSSVAYEVLRYAGAAYLLWLGVQLLRKPRTRIDVVAPGEATRAHQATVLSATRFFGFGAGIGESCDPSSPRRSATRS